MMMISPLRFLPRFMIGFLEAYTESITILRSSAVSTVILQQMQSQLDPYEQGIAITITQCIPSFSRWTIRSVRRIMGRGTGIWVNYMAHRTQFMGIESPAGHVVSTQCPVILRMPEEIAERFPWYRSTHVQSEFACPILQGDMIAGSVDVASGCPDYFTEHRQELIRRYAAYSCWLFHKMSFILYNRCK